MALVGPFNWHEGLVYVWLRQHLKLTLSGNLSKFGCQYIGPSLDKKVFPVRRAAQKTTSAILHFFILFMFACMCVYLFIYPRMSRAVSKTCEKDVNTNVT